jgi:hypothetical protein
MQQSTSTTLLFAWPHGACEIYNLHKPEPSVICNPYKVALLKYVKYQAMPQANTAAFVHHTIFIGITSKQWVARADFGWCTTFQEDIINNPLGSGVSTVMINSSYNNHTQADLHAILAALLFLQMQLNHIWHHQMQFQVITKHEASLNALCQLFKTDTHNPQWQLNCKWEILQSINHNNNIHNMKCQLAQDDNPTHQAAIDTANTCILEYQATHLTLVARQQPTLDYGLAYLRHRNTIINEK